MGIQHCVRLHKSVNDLQMFAKSTLIVNTDCSNNRAKIRPEASAYFIQIEYYLKHTYKNEEKISALATIYKTVEDDSLNNRPYKTASSLSKRKIIDAGSIDRVVGRACTKNKSQYFFRSLALQIYEDAWRQAILTQDQHLSDEDIKDLHNR